MAAGARGEQTFQAGEREVTVLFTNRALIAVELELGKGIFTILSGVRQQQIAMSDLAVLLQHGMEAARVDAHAGGRRITRNDAIDVLSEAGFPVVVGPVLTAVAAVLSYSGNEAEPSDDAGDDAPNA